MIVSKKQKATPTTPIEKRTKTAKQEKIMSTAKDKVVLQLNQELLNSVASSDFTKYNELCASDLTCFEPETAGILSPLTKMTSETRVWEKRNGVWKHVHFHKS